MNSTRFARIGRYRFLMSLGILVLIVVMLVIFHSSQVELEQKRMELLQCEQQQAQLNALLSASRYRLEKNERENSAHLETERNLEQKINQFEERSEKEQIEQNLRYDNLKQTCTVLENAHKRLEESQKVHKQQLDKINGLENKLQLARSELQKEKINKSGELIEWKEKYNIAANENKRFLEDKKRITMHISELEEAVKDYQSYCMYKANDSSRKPVAPKPNMSNHKTSEKSFHHQDSVSEGVYHISVVSKKDTKMVKGDGMTSEWDVMNNKPINAYVGFKDKLILQQTTKASSPLQYTLDTNNDTTKLAPAKLFNGSLILNSVENFQIVPKLIKIAADDERVQQEKPNLKLSLESNQNQITALSALKNRSTFASEVTAKNAQQIQVTTNTAVNIRNARDSSTISSNTSPLALPHNQRKLPANVAPIPENFEDLYKKSNYENLKMKDNPSQLDRNLKSNLKENKPMKPPMNNKNNNNFDSGAHEIKDGMAEYDSNNARHDDINNFFDNDPEVKERSQNKNLNDDKEDDGVNDDDDVELGANNDGGDNLLGAAAAGHIAIKHNQQVLLDDNLKNEVADDQGKEFGDGLRLDENAMEEDDDDDYSNTLARKQAGGQAIRN